MPSTSKALPTSFSLVKDVLGSRLEAAAAAEFTKSWYWARGGALSDAAPNSGPAIVGALEEFHGPVVGGSGELVVGIFPGVVDVHGHAAPPAALAVEELPGPVKKGIVDGS